MNSEEGAVAVRPEQPAPRERPRRELFLTGVQRVWILTAAVAAAAFVMALGLKDLTHLNENLRIPWWALAILFYAGEQTVVHIRLRRDAYSFSMSEIPLVAGLFLVAPLELIAAHVVGTAVALTIHRHQPPLKLVFNLSQFALVSAVAVVVFRELVQFGDFLGPTGWLAALVAALTGLIVANLLISAAIRLGGGSLSRRELVRVLGLSALALIMNTTLAVIGITILVNVPWGAVLALVPPVVLFVAYRTYISQQQEKARLRSLYEASRDLHRSPVIEDSVVAAASHARSMLEAETAVVALLPEGSAGTAYTTTVGPEDQVEVMKPITRGDLPPSWMDVLTGGKARLLAGPNGGDGAPAGPSDDFEEAVLVPLTGTDGVLGLMLVANSLSDVGRFEDSDIDILETLAGQVSVSVENGRLEDSLREVTKLKEELRNQALHDALTGLPNRRLFLERVDHALQRRQRDGGLIGVLFLDVDDFKTINDSLGHAAGDDLLVAIGEKLASTCRPGDTVARLGGDEFAFLLEGISDPGIATEVAERIISELSRSTVIADREITVRASVGIAFGGESDLPDRVLREADAAMYAAKRDGKGTFRLFKASMHAEMLDRLHLRTDLEMAIERDEFVLYYQPIVSLDTGNIAGFEALVRWNHSERGQLGPEQFIPFAEETGIIVPLGRWILHEACRQARVWQDRYPGQEATPMISVNISPKQLLAGDIIDEVSGALEESGLEPARLVIELTETVVAQASIETLERLKTLGIRVAIDDFGTGHSSLSYLDRLPIDVVKVDKTFVQRLGHGDEESPLVRTVIQLGESLGLETIAEGVESLAQLNRLRELGCTKAQGFFLGEPMAAPDVDEVLSSGSKGMAIADVDGRDGRDDPDSGRGHLEAVT